MSKFVNTISFLLSTASIVITTGCKEKYFPAINDPNTRYLVVEGFINNGAAPTVINLSRVVKLYDTTTIFKETRAVVRVEGKLNTTGFPLPETAPGIYTSAALTLDPADQYRIRVTTLNGKQYVSDYSAVRTTVDIDSVTWRVENTGLQISTYAHDAQNKTKYYLYKYDETWEFHSPFAKYLSVYYDRFGRADHVGYFDSVKGGYDTSLLRCWKSQPSTGIMINSTEALSEDRVSDFPLLLIENGSRKVTVVYSMNLKQYALSKEAYDFYTLLRKNTQQIGTIFDAQPTENFGNMHCLSNDEPVIGFIEVTQEKQKRMFINNAQLAVWNYVPACNPQYTLYSVDNLPFFIQQQDQGHYNMPTNRDPQYTGLDAVLFAPNICVDCTLTGTNKKPSFMP